MNTLSETRILHIFPHKRSKTTSIPEVYKGVPPSLPPSPPPQSDVSLNSSIVKNSSIDPEDPRNREDIEQFLSTRFYRDGSPIKGFVCRGQHRKCSKVDSCPEEQTRNITKSHYSVDGLLTKREVNI